jgi:hypothetical protein
VASTYAERPNGEAMRRGHAARPCGGAMWRSHAARPDGRGQTARPDGEEAPTALRFQIRWKSTMSSTYRYRTDMSNPVPANNRAICIERQQRILSPRLTRTPLSWWTNITARIRQSRRPRRHVWAAEDQETAEDQRWQKARDEARDG